MQEIKKIVGVNLIILAVYMILINVTSTGSERDLSIMVLSLLLIGVHVGMNLLISIVFFFQKNSSAKYYLLAAVIVGIIGFSACWGSVMI